MFASQCSSASHSARVVPNRRRGPCPPRAFGAVSWGREFKGLRLKHNLFWKSEGSVVQRLMHGPCPRFWLARNTLASMLGVANIIPFGQGEYPGEVFRCRGLAQDPLWCGNTTPDPFSKRRRDGVALTDDSFPADPPGSFVAPSPLNPLCRV